MKKILLTAVFGSMMVASLQAKVAGDVSAKASASLGATFLSSAKHDGKLATASATKAKGTVGGNVVYTIAKDDAVSPVTPAVANVAADEIKDLKKKTSFSTVLALEGDYNITDSIYAGLAFNYNFCNANVKMNDLKNSKFQIRGMYGLTAKVGYEYSNFDFALSVGYGWANTKVKDVYGFVDGFQFTNIADNTNHKATEDEANKFNSDNAKIDAANSSWKKRGSVVFGADVNYKYNDAVSFGVKYQGQKVQTKQRNTDNKLKAWAHTVALTACYHM